MMANIEAEVLRANIEYHSKLGNDYNKQPHINQNNKTRLRRIFKELASKSGNGELLDIGCGTGFLINIAKPLYKKIVGIDITPAMLKQVEKTKKVSIVEGNTAKMPFSSNRFNVCVSSSFLHHLYRLKPTFKEVYRVLKRGGFFFNDLDPNFHYFNQLKRLSEEKKGIYVSEVTSKGCLYQHHKDIYGLTKKTIDMAEYQRFVSGGMKEEEVKKELSTAGFKDIKFFYYWYVGQGEIEKASFLQAKKFDAYLQGLLPFSRNLYKYFGFYAKK